MASSRVRTGFHRLAIVLSFLFFIPAIVMLGMAGYAAIFYTVTDANHALYSALGLSAAAAFFYVAVRAIGWIVEGFVG
jgi:hypothetical protein